MRYHCYSLIVGWLKCNLLFSDNFFVAIFCFLSFNFFAMVGNATTEVIRVVSWTNSRFVDSIERRNDALILFI